MGEYGLNFKPFVVMAVMVFAGIALYKSLGGSRWIKDSGSYLYPT